MDLHEQDRALARDAADPVPTLRGEFHVPPCAGPYHEVAYFAGNSLGLQPRDTRAALLTELDDWARLGVEGHLEATHPWLPYHEELRGPAARLVGARPEEIVVMNSLTVNLHLMMATFYRPAIDGRGGGDRNGTARRGILIEDNAFPSDSYAVRSQAAFHGLDPDEHVVRVRAEAILDHLAREGERVALVLLGGVNYLTGEVLDIRAITAAGHAAGCRVGWDLAHAVGNVPLRLHDWGPDFAVWCSYKYLNAGPGAVAGCFVHARHLADASLPRLSGWWGSDPATRFLMRPVAEPVSTADAWQVSNPPILAMAPLRVSLEMFDRVGMPALRGRSERLTGYLASLLDQVPAVRVVTPADPARRGCQLSVRVSEAGKLARILRDEEGVVADVREPDTIRLAPVPLYSTYHDCWRAAEALSRWCHD
jgi:kynureninase